MTQPDPPKAPRWAGRVPRWKIARLYESNAAGIWDDALIDDVGMSLWARCRDCLRVTEAHRGRAPCPVCDAAVEHQWERDRALVCARCGWEGNWPDYLASYQDKQLHAGGMEGYFAQYIEQYPKARSARDRMLLIDLLIHRFHREYAGHAAREADPGRPGGVNLIGGRLNRIVKFLDALACGDRTAPELHETKQRWRRYVADAQTARAARLAQKRRHGEGAPSDE